MSVNDILIIAGFVFIIGLCIGSFLNVVILRSLSNESIVFPPSKCPVCGNSLKWWHNIPVLSYILLRGKCGFCHCKISPQYPIVELITGLLFTAVFLKYFVVGVATNSLNFGTLFAILYSWIIISLLIVLAVTDIKEKIVFDAHTYSLIGMGLLLNILSTGYLIYYTVSNGTFEFNLNFVFNTPLTNSLLGMLVGIVVMELLARAGYLFAGTRAFGEGDTYIAAGLGAVFGWKNVLWIVLLSIAIQILFTLPLFIKKLACNKDWKTIISLVLFFLYAAGMYFVQHKTSLMDNSLYLVVSMLIMLGLGIWACFEVIKGLKNKNTLTYLPFGPALAIAGLLLLVFNF